MECHLPFEIPSPTILFSFLVLICCVLFWIKSSSRDGGGKKRLPPEAYGSWPLIGHLHLFAGPEPHYKTLSKLAERYGPIFTIKIGKHLAVVVSNWKAVKECLGINDNVFANRPKSVAVEHLSYNYAMLPFAPYGPYWRKLRKISAVELLSNQRLDMLKHFRVSEVRAAINDARNKWIIKSKDDAFDGVVMLDMKKWFRDITMNNILRLVAGKCLKELSEMERNRYTRIMKDSLNMAVTFVPADALSFLRWLDIGGHEKAIKRLVQEIDDIAQGWLDEHKTCRASEDRTITKDFMGVMLDMTESPDPNTFNHDNDTIIKSTCLAMIIAGTESTESTLTWALSLLLNNRHVLKKAQEELDSHVGRQRLVRESDTNNLIYLEAILKETMRLYPAGPLAIPHEAITECYACGYYIPAGTRLLINIPNIHRDPDVWSNPSEFCPERFLTTHRDVDVGGQNFQLIPFGCGRRACPGISFALRIMKFTLASLLQNFDFGCQSEESMDMTEGQGLGNTKVSPLDVAVAPRLHENLYEISSDSE